MKEKVNILCLYWVGEFRGRDFSMNDVERLYQTVRKHIDRPFDFYCLTNTTEEFPSYVKPIPLIYAWPGWWSKMEIHRPDLPAGRTLYMDLDSHAVRSLGPILDYPGDLVMFDTRIDMSRQDRLRKDGWVLRYQAATMLFTPGCDVMQFVWRRFSQDPGEWMQAYRSDQDVMGDWIPNQPTFPKEWMIKLDTIRNDKSLRDDIIIVTGQTRDGLFRNTKKIEWFEKTAR
jgi:hypothetical protein